MKAFTILLISIFFISCSFNEEELIGRYTPVNYINSFDTIELKANNIYFRKVYDVHNKLLLEMDGEWRLDGDYIKFNPFYLNFDDDLLSFPESVQDTTGGWGGYIGQQNGLIEFCVGHLSASLPDQNCYRKFK